MPENSKQESSKEIDAAETSSEAEEILEEKKRKNTSGLSWDETIPKPGEKFNRVTDMGEAD